MTHYLTGAIPSTPDIADLRYAFQGSELLAGAALSDAGDIDLRDAHKDMLQYASSCVPTTFVELVQDLAIVQGDPIKGDLSVHGLYAEGRLSEGPPVPNVGILDSGSSCRRVLSVGRSRGIVAADEYPNDPVNATHVPPASYWEADPIVKIGTCRRILGDGNALVLREGIKAALKLAREGKCSIVSGVIPVDEAYTQTRENEVYRANGGRRLGLHAQAIGVWSDRLQAVGFYSTWPTGPRVIYVGIEWLAKYGFEFWIIENIIRVHPGAP